MFYLTIKTSPYFHEYKDHLFQLGSPKEVLKPVILSYEQLRDICYLNKSMVIGNIHKNQDPLLSLFEENKTKQFEKNKIYFERRQDHVLIKKSYTITPNEFSTGENLEVWKYGVIEWYTAKIDLKILMNILTDIENENQLS